MSQTERETDLRNIIAKACAKYSYAETQAEHELIYEEAINLILNTPTPTERNGEVAKKITDKHRGVMQTGRDLYEDVLTALDFTRKEGYRQGVEDSAKIADEECAYSNACDAMTREDIGWYRSASKIAQAIRKLVEEKMTDKCCQKCSPEYVDGKPHCDCECHKEEE